MPALFRLPKIYAITDRELAGISHQEQIALLIEGGAEMVQIRDKNASSREFFVAASECIEIARKHNVKLIVNDRVDIAAIVKADGVHLGQGDLPPIEARKLLGSEAIIGLSTHNIEQAIAAVDLPIDYIAAGPVFETGTKADREPVIGLDGLSVIRKATAKFPLVAIGGINIRDLTNVYEAGADSAAMISSLVGTPIHITERMREAIIVSL